MLEQVLDAEPTDEVQRRRMCYALVQTQYLLRLLKCGHTILVLIQGSFPAPQLKHCFESQVSTWTLLESRALVGQQLIYATSKYGVP